MFRFSSSDSKEPSQTPDLDILGASFSKGCRLISQSIESESLSASNDKADSGSAASQEQRLMADCHSLDESEDGHAETAKPINDKKDKQLFSNRSRLFQYESIEPSANSETNNKSKNGATKPVTPVRAKQTVAAHSTDDSASIATCSGPATADKTTTDPMLDLEACVMPPPPAMLPSIDDLRTASTSMLTAWYMAGYQTGYYEAMRRFKRPSDGEISVQKGCPSID